MFSILLPVMAVVSCGPLTYTLPVEKMVQPDANVDFAGRIVYDDNGVEVFNFGKYKGMPVAEVLRKDIGYFGWIMNGDFALNTKNVLTKIRLRETGMLK